MAKSIENEIADKILQLKALEDQYFVTDIKAFGNVLGNYFSDPADIHFLIQPGSKADQISILKFEKAVKELFFPHIVKLYTKDSLTLMVEDEKTLTPKMRDAAINSAVELEHITSAAKGASV